MKLAIPGSPGTHFFSNQPSEMQMLQWFCVLISAYLISVLQGADFRRVCLNVFIMNAGCPCISRHAILSVILDLERKALPISGNFLYSIVAGPTSNVASKLSLWERGSWQTSNFLKILQLPFLVSDYSVLITKSIISRKETFF